MECVKCGSTRDLIKSPKGDACPSHYAHLYIEVGEGEFTKVFRLRQRKCKYEFLEAMRYDEKMGAIVPDGHICDFEITIRLKKEPSISGISVPCPVCLKRLLDSKVPFKVDDYGNFFTPDALEPYYDHPENVHLVETLHWGIGDGTVGTCYTCAGAPELKPIW